MKQYFTVLFLFLSLVITGQTVNIPKHSVTVRTYYGFIVPHHKGLTNLITGHVPGFEIDFGKQTNGSLLWHHNLNFPVSGVSFSYNFLGNKEQLGSYFSVSPYILFPIIDKKLKFNLKLNGGAAYITKPFNIANNYKNELIGSHINGFIRFLTEVAYPVSSSITLNTGVSFSHISNGSFKKPNLGINMPAISVGVKYNLNQQPSYYEPIENLTDTSKITVTIGFDGGLRNDSPLDREYPAFNLYTVLWYDISSHSAIGLNSDIFYNTVLYNVYFDKTGKAANVATILQHAISLGYKLRLHKTELYIQFGAYTYSQKRLQGPVYEKIGIYHWINNKIYLNCNLKAHYGVADFFEFGFGYKLWEK